MLSKSASLVIYEELLIVIPKAWKNLVPGIFNHNRKNRVENLSLHWTHKNRHKTELVISFYWISLPGTIKINKFRSWYRNNLCQTCNRDHSTISKENLMQFIILFALIYRSSFLFLFLSHKWVTAPQEETTKLYKVNKKHVIRIIFSMIKIPL